MFELDTAIEIMGMPHPCVVIYSEDDDGAPRVSSVHAGKELPESQYSPAGEYLGYYRTSIDVLPILGDLEIEDLMDRIEAHRRKLAESY